MNADNLTFGKLVRRLSAAYWWIMLVCLPAQFIYFKLQYPYPNCRGDSQSYIAAAAAHLTATEWPFGYSKFRPGKIVFTILFAFLIFNPLLLHLGNYIIVALVLPILLISLFINYTENRFYEFDGVRQFLLSQICS
jgi:hypothetical protein